MSRGTNLLWVQQRGGWTSPAVERIQKLERKIGEMTLDMDILREAAKPYRPTDGRTSDE
jgi:hypothetical protein